MHGDRRCPGGVHLFRRDPQHPVGTPFRRWDGLPSPWISAELAPSSPTRARYWSTDPSRRDRPRNSDRPWKSMTCRKRSRASQVSTSWSTVIRTPASVTAVPVRAASCSRVTAATMVVEPVQGQVPYHARNPRLWRRTVRHDAAGRGCGCPPQRDPALCHALRHRQHRRRR